MNAQQCRMARAALGIGVRDLAAMADVSQATISKLERGEPLRPQTLDKVRAALEGAGVVLIEENGGGVGARLARPSEG